MNMSEFDEHLPHIFCYAKYLKCTVIFTSCELNILILNRCQWKTCPQFFVMTLSFRTDRSGQTVQTQTRLLLVWSGSSLFAIPFASFGQNVLWFGLFVWILGSLQHKLLVSENLGTLRYLWAYFKFQYLWIISNFNFYREMTHIFLQSESSSNTCILNNNLCFSVITYTGVMDENKCLKMTIANFVFHFTETQNQAFRSIFMSHVTRRHAFWVSDLVWHK